MEKLISERAGGRGGGLGRIEGLHISELAFVSCVKNFT